MATGALWFMKFAYDNFIYQSDEDFIKAAQEICKNITEISQNTLQSTQEKNEMSDEQLKQYITQNGTSISPFGQFHKNINNSLNNLRSYARKLVSLIEKAEHRKSNIDALAQLTAIQEICIELSETVNSSIQEVSALQKRVISFPEYKLEKVIETSSYTLSDDFDEDERWEDDDNDTPAFGNISASTVTAHTEHAQKETKPESQSFIKKVSEFIHDHGDEILEHQREYHEDWFNVN